jgi:hypothetical protein
LTVDDFPSLTTTTIPTAPVAVSPIVYTTGYPDGYTDIDATASSYVVLVPILTTTTQTVYEKQPDTIVQQAPVSCTDQQNAFNLATASLSSA